MSQSSDNGYPRSFNNRFDILPFSWYISLANYCGRRSQHACGASSSLGVSLMSNFLSFLQGPQMMWHWWVNEKDSFPSSIVTYRHQTKLSLFFFTIRCYARNLIVPSHGCQEKSFRTFPYAGNLGWGVPKIRKKKVTTLQECLGLNDRNFP